MLRVGAGGVSPAPRHAGVASDDAERRRHHPRVCQIAPASLLLAGADPNQSWVFAGDSLAQPIVGRDGRDGALKMVSSCSATTRRSARPHRR